MKRKVLLSILIALALTPHLQGQDLTEAKELLAMEPLQAKEKIESFTAEHARDLISQVRHIGREKYKDVDHLYLLLEHLSTLQATELAQKRLNNLLLVLGLTLALFTMFLIYVIVDQRRTLQKLRTVAGEAGAHQPDKPQVYRGESS